MTLLNTLPLELETIILDYQFELESELRVETHKVLFRECLENIRDLNKYIHNEFMEYIELDITDEIINITWRDIELNLPNLNEWRPNKREMVYDLFFNYRTYQEHDRESFVNENVEEMFEGDIEEIEDHLEEVNGWWNNIELIEEFVEEVIGEHYLGLFNKESFLEYVLEL